MKTQIRFFSALTVTLIVSGLLLATVAQAKSPRTKNEIARETKMLLDVVKKGDDLWHSPGLGTNGLACANCHPDGAASNPHTFPKYQSNLGKVGTLREMINWCANVVLQGPSIPFDSDEMVALEAYSIYTHRGVAFAPAMDEQHGAVPVKSGPGYPMK